MQVDIVNQPATRVAAVRHTGPYNQISRAFEKLGSIAGPAGLFGPNTAMLGLYYDDPQSTPADKLRSDAAITVDEGVKVPSGLTEATVPGGRYARATYKGPYDGLPDAWTQVMEWFEKSGEQMGDGPSYELYRNDPSDTAPEDLITEIYLPLA